MWQEAAAGNIHAFLVNLLLIGRADIVLHSSEPCLVVAPAEVYGDDPFQSVARWRGEEQLRGEIRVFQQCGFYGMHIAHMVKVEAKQSAVLRKAVVSAVAECAREACKVKVRDLVPAHLLFVSPALVHLLNNIAQCMCMHKCVTVECYVLVGLLNAHRLPALHR